MNMWKDCICGHLGSQHRDDKTCVRCDCEHYVRPTYRYDRGPGLSGKDLNRKTARVGANWR